MKTSGTLILSKLPREAMKPITPLPEPVRPKMGGVRVHRVDGRQRLAKKIAAALFVNGQGQRAKRLVLELENNRDGGGGEGSSCGTAEKEMNAKGDSQSPVKNL